MDRKMEFAGHNENTFVTLKKRLMKNFYYPFHNVIFVWCPYTHVDPDFVATLLGSYNSEVIVNNHWVPSRNSLPTLKIWSGALALYIDEKDAKLAADDIKKKSDSFRVLSFQEIMEILMQAEYFHPNLTKEATKIVLKANIPFQEDHISDLKFELYQFGKPKKIIVYRKRSRSGIIAEVEYPTLFQAYTAKIAMDGYLYDCLGHITVEIVQTTNGKKFEQFVRNRFRRIAENY